MIQRGLRDNEEEGCYVDRNLQHIGDNNNQDEDNDENDENDENENENEKTVIEGVGVADSWLLRLNRNSFNWRCEIGLS